MKPLSLTDQELESILSEQSFLSGFAAIEFWSFRCEASRKVAPVVSQISETLSGRLKVFKVNVDENPRVVSKFAIPLVPYLLILKDGQSVRAFAENWSLEEVLTFLSQPEKL